MKLWPKETCERLLFFPAPEKKKNGAVVIFPGGAYAFLADHEGRGYAEFLNAHGYDAFVCLYRTFPDAFPLPLLDARRAMRLARAQMTAREGSPAKIAAMGSSAGGHLTALLSTYLDKLPGEDPDADAVDALPFLPDLQILCYPVISLVDDAVTHAESRANFTAGNAELYPALSPELLVRSTTPPAFLWHTADDPGVPAENSLFYADALVRAGVETELHVFPHGDHGLGLAENDPIVGAWRTLLLARLRRL